jgi:transposase
MPLKLSDTEIKHRLTRLTNLERLHTADQHVKAELRAEVKQLKAENANLRAQFASTIAAQAARIDELEAMVFGRKPNLPRQAKLRLTTKRALATYRRPIPPAAAITAEQHHSIDVCHRCGHELTDKTEVIRYEEDIVLAALDPRLDSKTVTRHTVEQGWCSQCGQYSSAMNLRGQDVFLGPAVRSYVTYLSCHLDLSYTQVQDLLMQQHCFYLASSEITAILDQRRAVYLPMYEQLETSIRAGPAHVDETRCSIQSEAGSGFAHVMASSASEDAVFKLADSRGKGNSKALVGTDYQAVGITDRYGSYKHLFGAGKHQICWAHLQRTAKDLTKLESLDETVHRHVTQFYHALATIYAATRHTQTESFELTRRATQSVALLEQVVDLCQPHRLDPKKLQALKAGILEYQDCLFLCLTIDGIPADNNKAERALRKLVMKRKKSYGVRTMKGARTMEVLLSICHSVYYRDKGNLLPNLHALAANAA